MFLVFIPVILSILLRGTRAVRSGLAFGQGDYVCGGRKTENNPVSSWGEEIEPDYPLNRGSLYTSITLITSPDSAQAPAMLALMGTRNHLPSANRSSSLVWLATKNIVATSHPVPYVQTGWGWGQEVSRVPRSSNEGSEVCEIAPGA